MLLLVLGLNENILYPRTNLLLSRKIVDEGGGILSEFENDFKATEWSFPQRNRIMAGLSNAVLVIEATKSSGSLITAKLALDYNREVLSVPGSVFSKNSEGTNWLIKEGAVPITNSEDIMEVLNIKPKKEIIRESLSKEEENIIKNLDEPITKDELLRKIKMETNEAFILISKMEIKGLIKEFEGKIYISWKI